MTSPRDEPRVVSLEEVAWSEAEDGVREREAEVDGARWAVVEYEPGAGRSEWCEDGHKGYVVRGRIEYEFDDGRQPISVLEGEVFRLPPARAGDGAHRGRNPSPETTRLFLIDDSRP